MLVKIDFPASESHWTFARVYRRRRLSTTPNLFVNKLNDVSAARIANATEKPPVSQELCTIVGEKEPLTSKGIIRSEIVSISTYILELSLYPRQRNLQYHSSSSHVQYQ